MSFHILRQQRSLRIGYAVGKMILQEDASGWQVFSYGKLGEVTENIRTFALPFESQPYTFKMNFEYDSWNRIQQMIYPDGEVVNYGYNCGGLLSSISGEMVRRISDVLQPASLQGNAVQTNGTIGGGMAPVNPPIGPIEQPTVTCRYPYIDSILYNKFELRDSVVYGNGTSTHYEYDSLQRLSRLRSYAALGIKMQDVAYTYDNASNITHIANTAGTMSGLGGGYERNYTYDNLYRLTSAKGNWSNRRTTLPDTLDMSYSPNGRILSKSVHSTTLIEGVQKDVSYANAYTYNDNNQLKYTTNDAGSIQQSFSWDGSGNMLTMSIPDNTRRTSVRTFSWTEDNRLQTALDKNWFSYYQYDAGGERTFKITWTGTTQSVNARQQTYYTPANATLYASPYLVITQQGYTKHYYAESERVVSKVGKDAFAGISNAVVSDSAVAVKRLAVSDDVALPEWSTLPDSTRFAFLYTLSNQQESIAECYFYHTDHLGSASWITYTDGKPVQHLYYMPWGERLVDQRKSTYEGSLFAFSAKERDVETGLSYFGARYYSSDLSIWLAVDPMSGKYPSLSPYVYCADNPVKLVDPNGEEIWFPDVDGNLIAQDGDNYKSLAVTINCSYNKAKKILANQGYKDGVNEGDKVNLDNPYTRSINATCEQRLTDDQAVAYALQWNKLGLSDEEMELRYKELACPQDLYNCWSAAITGANGGMIGPGNYDIFTEEEFDRSLDNKYPVGTDKFKFGKTIFKFEQNGKCTHAAVYYGSDKENNIYIYSKNGRFSKPFVMPLNEFLERYGFQYGEVSGYYN